MSKDFEEILARLRSAPRPESPAAPDAKRAAVAIGLVANEGRTELLMIQRAVREGDPWSGHMGFPGGRRDSNDSDDLACALRETHEEIGADYAANGELVCQLSDVNTGWRADRPEMLVAPFVFALKELPAFRLNHEVDSVLWVPLDFLLETSNRGMHQWQWQEKSLETDCYRYQGHLIWGLSLLMIDELLALIRP